MTLRLGFSDTVLVDPLTRDSLDGIGIYTRELRARLAGNSGIALMPVVMGPRTSRAAPPGAFTFAGRPSIEAVRSIVLGAPFRGASKLAECIDVYLATDYRIPRLRGTPVCATIFDAIPLSHPEWANPQMRCAKNWILRHSIQWADRVLAISQAMVPQIVEHYGIAQDRIAVTPLGVGGEWFIADSPVRIREVRERHGVAPKYFLSVGTLQPRKNIARVVEAYVRLPLAIRAEHQLVVVGKVGWSAASTVELLRRHAASGVRWLERIPDDELRSLYQGATAFVFPSLYEGFGLPVVEAFASGTPVIASTGTSLPEIVGDAGCLVDALDVEAIGAALERIVDNPAWADVLRAKGRERAKRYSWDACASLTAAVLREMA
jgi:glycosyltransferase involved in cell wall biosynthesis